MNFDTFDYNTIHNADVARGNNKRTMNIISLLPF